MNTSLLANVGKFNADGFLPYVGLRIAIGVMMALSLGLAFSSPTVGVVRAVGALTSGAAELSSAAHDPRTTMVGAGFALAFYAFLGSVTSHLLLTQFVVLILIALVVSILSETGQIPSAVAVQSLMGYVILG